MVIQVGDLSDSAFSSLLSPFDLRFIKTDSQCALPGSHFGEPEAGLIGNTLFARDDTPVHSVLHEACHYICMDWARRQTLHSDAGGGFAEEDGVCYLSIVLADRLTGYNQQQMFKDMDAWGYSFRLGSAQAWFEKDSDDALQWLIQHNIFIDPEIRCRHQ